MILVAGGQTSAWSGFAAKAFLEPPVKFWGGPNQGSPELLVQVGFFAIHHG
jgi:hypothetical protein